MSSLSDSAKLKAAGAKGPAVTGPPPVSTPDSPLDEGKSGGIAKAKQVKNAGSTKLPTGTPDESFLRSIGGSSQTDKTVGNF